MDAYSMSEYEDRWIVPNYDKKEMYGYRHILPSTPIKRRHYDADIDEADEDCDLLSDGGYFSISPSSTQNCSFRRSSEKQDRLFGKVLRSPFKADDVISTPRKLSMVPDFQRNRMCQSFACESTPKKNSPYSPRRCFTERKYNAPEYPPYQPRSHSCLKSSRRYLDSSPECSRDQIYQRSIPRRNLYEELDAVKTRDSFKTRQENCSFYTNSIGQRSPPCCTTLSESNKTGKICDCTRRRTSFRCDDDMMSDHYRANVSESRTSSSLFEKPMHTRCQASTNKKKVNSYPWCTPSVDQRIISSFQDCEDSEEESGRMYETDRPYTVYVDPLRSGDVEKLHGCGESGNDHSIIHKTKANRGYPCYTPSSSKSTHFNREYSFQSGTSRIPPTTSKSKCSCSELKQGLLRLASGAYSNIRRKASSPEDFRQFKTELDLTNAFLQQTLDMIKRIKSVCGNCD